MSRCLALIALLVASPAAAHDRDRPDPYFGGREYPDPYIWDGWSGDGGYRGHAYYAQSSPYLSRRDWPFYAVYEHRSSTASDIEALSRGRYDERIEGRRRWHK
jgi:hypothetical protein